MLLAAARLVLPVASFFETVWNCVAVMLGHLPDRPLRPGAPSDLDGLLLPIAPLQPELEIRVCQQIDRSRWRGRPRAHGAECPERAEQYEGDEPLPPRRIHLAAGRRRSRTV